MHLCLEVCIGAVLNCARARVAVRACPCARRSIRAQRWVRARVHAPEQARVCVPEHAGVCVPEHAGVCVPEHAR
eukprot:2548968-Pleurochrysis_carterae.AAC.1